MEQSLRSDAKLTVDDEKAKAIHGNSAADADLAAQIAERAVIELDPRQPETARISANAKLEVARAAAYRARVGGQLAVQTAERASEAVQDKIQQAVAAKSAASLAEKSVRLEGEKTVRAALDAQKLAAVDAKLSAERARQLAADLEAAKRKVGVQVPVDELVFIPSLPVRVEEVKVLVGTAAVGTVLTVTDNQLAIDSSLSLESAPLVKPGMPAVIDEQALGVKATGKVQLVASTPGTRAGVDPLHVYMEIKVDATQVRLEGASVRVTIPIKSTQGAVTAVPNSAVSLAADGSSRVQVKRKDALEYVVVTPGLSADGFIEVAPLSGKLEPGELVVVGYNNPRTADDSAKSGASEGKANAAFATTKPPDPK